MQIVRKEIIELSELNTEKIRDSGSCRSTDFFQLGK